MVHKGMKLLSNLLIGKLQLIFQVFSLPFLHCNMSANVQNSIMLFGDSITQGGWETGMNGFGASLARELPHIDNRCGMILRFFLDRYARKLDVINRGFSGYNTEWGIPVFEQVSEVYDTATVH